MLYDKFKKYPLADETASRLYVALFFYCNCAVRSLNQYFHVWKRHHRELHKQSLSFHFCKETTNGFIHEGYLHTDANAVSDTVFWTLLQHTFRRRNKKGFKSKSNDGALQVWDIHNMKSSEPRMLELMTQDVLHLEWMPLVQVSLPPPYLIGEQQFVHLQLDRSR